MSFILGATRLLKNFKKGREVLIFVFLKDNYNKNHFICGNTIGRNVGGLERERERNCAVKR